jgi:head-tail adaptor
MQQAIRTSLLICVVTVVVNAADRNWNIGNDVQWNNIATWHEGAIPTAADDVYLNVGSTISVSGSDASANSVALHNSAGTCSLKVQNGAGLTVTEGVTDPGSGTAKVRVENTNPATAASRLAASSLQTRILEIKGYLETDYDIALDV